MSNYNGSKVPLHLQNAQINKAAKTAGENFRQNEIHTSKWSAMEERPGIGAESVMRRYPNGELDFEWALGHLLSAIENYEYNNVLSKLDEALLTLMYPGEFGRMMPQQAEILTKLSASEKSKLKDMMDARYKEMLNYNGAAGGGTVPGRHLTRA